LNIFSNKQNKMAQLSQVSQVSQLSQLSRVYKTVINMLKKRGFTDFESGIIENVENIDLTFSKEQLTIIASKDNEDIDNEEYENTTEKIIVFFSEEDKLGVKSLKNYYNKMTNLDIINAIIVVKENATSFAKNDILEVSRSENPLYIEIFLENQLVFDITEHVLQPKFRKLSKKEKNEFLQKMDIKETQIAKMLTSDPIARFYNFKEKDIIEIIEISETGGYYTKYRIVI